MSIWDQFVNDWQTKKVLIFGLGQQGGGVKTANTFARTGAKVRVSDLQSAEELAQSVSQLNPSIELALGGHQKTDIDWADLIIKNPAVPYDHPLIQQALRQKKLVVGETALAMKYIRDQSIAVTGTRGKTTTTWLIYHLLKESGVPAIIAGNIPNQPLLAILPEVTPETQVVIEISSFQIESLKYLGTSAHISVITTLYPDHLNRYSSWPEYVKSKTDLFKYQKNGDIAVYQSDQPWSGEISSSIPAHSNEIRASKEIINQLQQRVRLKIPGQHNWENAALATTVTSYLGLSETQINRGLQTFAGVPFRLQVVAELENIKFINDTTSTTPVALEKALEAYADKKIVLIAGGASKNIELASDFLQKVATIPQAIILLSGEGQIELQTGWQNHNISVNSSKIKVVESLPEAVNLGFQVAKEQSAEVVLFSPGFTSFDRYKNEFDRGEDFNQLVQAIINK
jgi:UDP-N-acetylmuramoylalanine--D-glutamate ligase